MKFYLAVEAQPSRKVAEQHEHRRGRVIRWRSALYGVMAVAVALVQISMPPLRTDAAAASAGPDLIASSASDAAGYHVFVAKGEKGWQWQALATLQPRSATQDQLNGQLCTSGDGGHIAALVIPNTLEHDASRRGRRAMAYSIGTSTGSVTPLASGLAMNYSTPGCGIGSIASFTRYDDQDESVTEIFSFDLASGRMVGRWTVNDEVTNVVPVEGGVIGVVGNRLVGLRTMSPAVTTLATIPGTPYDVRSNGLGGVDFLVADVTAATTQLWSFADGRAMPSSRSRVPLGSLKLFAGGSGVNTVVGYAGSPVNGIFHTATTTDVGRTVTASNGGSAILLAPSKADSALTLGQGQMATASKLVSTDGGAILAARLPDSSAGSRMTVVPTQVTASGASAPNTTSPTCSVPRNDPSRQVLQPSNGQIDWAIQEGVRNLLNGANTRPADAWNLGYPAYSPSTDFPDPALSGASGIPVPAQLIEGIFAAESNWNQASWHAPTGLPGNPLIADYYGTNSTDTTVDYNSADCGYGLGQITDFMGIGPTRQPQSIKDKVAVDYAENTVAAISILASKWNDLFGLGITANDANPNQLEDWYLAAWAYNTGIHPDDGSGDWGLGWSNNPINPAYPPDRGEYLYSSYADAATPSNWPYQEQVMGWMDSPIIRDGHDAYTSATPSGEHLSIPPIATFCDSSDSCDPSDPSKQYCAPQKNSVCWWHKHATFAGGCQPVGSCHAEFFNIATTATEPTVTNPDPPVCARGTSLPASADIVDDLSGDLNLVGCPAPPADWSSSGQGYPTFQSESVNSAVGTIDYHQLGGGFGGHFYFTHNRVANEAQQAITYTWYPSAITSPGANYHVEVFIPSLGATEPHATYTINPGTFAGITPVSTTVTINQNSYSNQWVDLGVFQLGANATLSLSNVDNDQSNDGAFDVAFDAAAFVPENMSYYGGTVLTTVNVYLIFWQPTAVPQADYNSKLSQYVRDAGQTAEFNDVVKQYYQTVAGANQYVSSIALKGTYIDTHAYPLAPNAALCGAGVGCPYPSSSCAPACLDDASIADEVRSVSSTQPGWANAPNNVYLVFPGSNEAICDAGGPSSIGSDCSFNSGPRGNQQICGYHWQGSGGYVYGAIAYPDTQTNCSESLGVYGPVDDGGINITAHELMEAITDPQASGWCGDSGHQAVLGCIGETEIGDKCAFTLPFVKQPVGSNSYLIQPMWSNRVSACAY